jgi:biotin/methionine sulfoxide reductase
MTNAMTELGIVSMPDGDRRPHSSHWGTFSARMRAGQLNVPAYAGDPDPSRLIDNFPTALRHRTRIAQPMARRGWRDNGPGPDRRRGRDTFVPPPWERMPDLLGAELARVRDTHGLGAVFGGSYGWASTCRFHQAKPRCITSSTCRSAAMSARSTATVRGRPRW